MAKPKRANVLGWTPWVLGSAEEDVCSVVVGGREVRPSKCMINNMYQVLVYYQFQELAPGSGVWLHYLSIKRRDKKPIRDWRQLQYIKNDIIGEEHAGFEIFPPESALIDTSNQYHLFILAESGNLPFGFNHARDVQGPADASKVGARQEPFPRDRLPGEIEL